MNELEMKLYKYIKSQSSGKMDLIAKIESYHADMILNQAIKEISKEKGTIVEQKLSAQKVLNAYRKKEITNMSKLFEERNLKLVHFKGLTLAEELYMPSNIRKSADIDILVDKYELNSVFLALKDLGYDISYYESATRSGELNFTLNGVYGYTISRCSHMAEIYKYLNEYFTISLDVHTRLFGAFKYNESWSRDILERKTSILFGTAKIPILEIHDRLLQMLYHFTKEITNTDFKFLLTKDKNNRIRLNLLHDIAVFITKYNTSLNWNLMFQRAIEYQIYGEVLFSLRALKAVYGINILENEEEQCFENLLNYNQNLMGGIERRAVGKLLEMDVHKILSWEISEIYQNVISKLNWLGPKLVCKRNGELRYYVLDESHDKKFNLFNTYIKNIKKGYIIDYIPACAFEWDSESFKVHLKICFKSEEILENFEENAIQINIGGKKNINGVPFVEGFVFRCKNNKLLCSKLYRSNRNQEKEYEYEHNVSFEFQKCKLYITFPWEYIRTNPQMVDSLWFDFAITINGTQMALANPIYNRGMFDDLTMAAQLYLE